MQSQIVKQFHKDTIKTRATQGDILKDLELINYIGKNEDGSPKFIVTVLQYGVVISQDCDLEQDYQKRNDSNSNQDKFLSSIIVLPAYLSEDFKEGNHRGENLSQKWNSQLWKPIENNNNPRFHYINEDVDLQIPRLILDFKQVFVIARDYLYQNLQSTYLATICELYRESISQRYCQYLSRIGLPELTKNE